MVAALGGAKPLRCTRRGKIVELRRVVIGGERLATVGGGCYLAPTIFDDVAASHTIAREEIFGPVLSVIAFDDEAEALAIANDSEYGLAAGVFTSDLSRAHRVARRLRAGSVWVNYWDGGDMTAPFGGYKQSGNGRDRGLIGITFRLTGKTSSPLLEVNPLSVIAPGVFRSIFEFRP